MYKRQLLYYPAGSLYGEYTMAQGNQDEETMAVWKFMVQYPIEGGKYDVAGNPGYMWAFSAPFFEGQEGKLLRVLHMIDTMCVGGENFSHTAQGADDIVYDQFGIERIGSQEFIYTDDGMFYIRQTNLDENGGEQFPYDQGSYGGLALASWQNFGLNVSWQLSDPDTGDPVIDNANAITNEAIKMCIRDRNSTAARPGTRWSPRFRANTASTSASCLATSIFCKPRRWAR